MDYIRRGLRIRHKKRHSEYTVALIGAAQCSTGPIQENDTVVAYTDELGRTWFRKLTEMVDGRFEEIRP
jgi:uncharacterized protein with von Willebrand factor type A (vWA) domain